MKNRLLIILLIFTSFIFFSCEKEDIEYGTVTDCDGNTYTTVVIGNQEWMAENLAVTHYPNDTAILYIKETSGWSLGETYEWQDLEDNNEDDAYCYYTRDENKRHGALYTYAAAKDACPDGWHLPSDAEWVELINYVANDGYSGEEAKALKSTYGWDEYVNDANVNGTDIYGFSALPGGYRSSYSISNVSNYGSWWSSTEDGAFAYTRYLNSTENYTGFNRGKTRKSTGCSVRCLKDNY